jgi:hypothetical protein
MSGVYINTRFNISSASSNGTELIYICNNNFSTADRIIITGSSNPDFDTEDSIIKSATETQFIIENDSVSSSATSTGGIAYDVFGQWRAPETVYVKVDGSWRIVEQTFANIGGSWRQTTLGRPPERPIMDWHSLGKFRITNYSSSIYYETRFANGSGSVSLDASTGIYTLSGPNSGFYVSAAYAPGAPKSEEGYMERKAKVAVCGNFPECGTAPSYPCKCRPNRIAICNEPPGDGGVCPNPGLPGASCGCYDASQNRCICWAVGPDYCDTCGGGFNYCCSRTVDFSGQGYTDRVSEWSKQL